MPVPEETAEPSGGMPGSIEEAIEAVRTADGARLGDLLTTTDGPCVVNPQPDILVPPACPEGMLAGSPVPAIVFGACPDGDVTFIDPEITYFITDVGHWPGSLIGVVDLGPAPIRYAALFGFEKVFWLGFDDAGSLIGAGGGGSCAAFDLRPRLSEADWHVGPEWPD